MPEQEAEIPKDSNIWKARAPVTIVGVLLIGIICSALYDFFIKPGINVFAEKLFNFVTFGSQHVKDFSFYNAALDPTALPSLIIVVLISVVVVSETLRKAVRIYLPKPKGKDRKQLTKAKLSALKWGVLPFLILVQICVIFVPLNVYNQSVLIWRIFHANKAIISPYIDDAEAKKIEAAFASMETEADYDKLANKIESVANNNGVKLRDGEPW